MNQITKKRKHTAASYVEELCLCDDVMMNAAFMIYPELAGILISRALKIIVEPSSVTTQKRCNNVEGHSVIFDVYVVGKNGSHFVLEIQNKIIEGLRERECYYAGMLKAMSLPKGDDYANAPQCILVFFVRKGVESKDEPVLLLARYDEKKSVMKEDTLIYEVNLDYRDPNTEWGRTAQSLCISNPDDMQDKTIAEIVRKLKYSKERRTMMTALAEQWLLEEKEESKREGREEGREEGLKEGREECLEIILSFRKGDISAEEAAKRMGMSAERFEAIVNGKPAS